MEMWRPRLRCTLQHSSHTSTPLLMEAQPGSARGGSNGQRRPGHGQCALGSALGLHYAHTLQVPRSLTARTAQVAAAAKEAELRRRRDFPKGSEQVTDSCTPSYTSLPGGGGGSGAMCGPQGLLSGYVFLFCSLSQGTRRLAQPFPREAGVLWGM